MDAMIFLGFVLTSAVGVVFLALALKFMDLHEQVAEGDKAKRTPKDVSVAAKMPAFFGTRHGPRLPPASLGFRDRLPAEHELDRRHVLWALEQTRDNRARAAMLLGTSEAMFNLLVARYCGGSPTLDDGPFAVIQSHIWAEQALVREFVHLPSVSSLYRPVTPSLMTR